MSSTAAVRCPAHGRIFLSQVYVSLYHVSVVFCIPSNQMESAGRERSINSKNTTRRDAVSAESASQESALPFWPVLLLLLQQAIVWASVLHVSVIVQAAY